MSKAKQNTFLTGYFAILAAGAAGLGYLAWSSWAASTEARETYDTKKSRLQSLQKAPIFPKPENVEAKKKQVDEFAAKVTELNNKLREFEVPLDTAMASSAFQNKLQVTRDAIVTQANDSGVKLPEAFDLGFGTYLSTFPEPTAVPRLNAWLDGIASFFQILIANGVKEVNVVSRPELPFEKGAPAATPAAADKKKPAPKPAAAAKGAAKAAPAVAAIEESAVLERYPFHVTFTTSNRSLNEILTALAGGGKTGNSPGFYNIRVLRIENEQKLGAETSKQVQVQEQNDEATQKPYKRDSEFIFGVEKVTVHLGLDLIRFPAAEAETAKK